MSGSNLAPGRRLTVLSLTLTVGSHCLEGSMGMMTANNPVAVRRPIGDELEPFDLDDVISWSGLRGDTRYAYSQAGSLVVLLCGDGNTDSAEFVSATPQEPEAVLAMWFYSKMMSTCNAAKTPA